MLRARGVFNPNVTIFSKPDVTAATAWNTGAIPIFTVTGTVLMTCAGAVTTAMTSTGANGTIALGVTGSVAAFIAATTVDGTKLHVAKQIWVDTAGISYAVALPGTSSWYMVSGTNVILTVATNNMASGGMDIFAMWTPLSAGATVV